MIGESPVRDQSRNVFFELFLITGFKISVGFFYEQKMAIVFLHYTQIPLNARPRGPVPNVQDPPWEIPFCRDHSPTETPGQESHPHARKGNNSGKRGGLISRLIHS